jgi:hypothetical protein
MAKSVKDLLAAANAVVPRITPAQAQAMTAEGNTGQDAPSTDIDTSRRVDRTSAKNT